MIERINNRSKLEHFPHSRLPAFSKDEIDLIRGTYDFFGLNHYTTFLVRDYEYSVTHSPSHYKDMGVVYEQDPSWKPSKAPWLKVVPWGFRKLLVWIKRRYGDLPVLVTENGFADDGQLNDSGRISYYKVAKIQKQILW